MSLGNDIVRAISFTVDTEPVAQPRLTQRWTTTRRGKPVRTAFVRSSRNGEHPVVGYKLEVAKEARVAVASYNYVARQSGMPAWDDWFGLPVLVHTTYVLARPKKMRPGPRVYAPVRPDMDNLDKAVFDAVKGIVWGDDSQVVSGTRLKVYAGSDEGPHVEVYIEQLGRRAP